MMQPPNSNPGPPGGWQRAPNPGIAPRDDAATKQQPRTPRGMAEGPEPQHGSHGTPKTTGTSWTKTRAPWTVSRSNGRHAAGSSRRATRSYEAYGSSWNGKPSAPSRSPRWFPWTPSSYGPTFPHDPWHGPPVTAVWWASETPRAP